MAVRFLRISYFLVIPSRSFSVIFISPQSLKYTTPLTDSVIHCKYWTWNCSLKENKQFLILFFQLLNANVVQYRKYHKLLLYLIWLENFLATKVEFILLYLKSYTLPYCYILHWNFVSEFYRNVPRENIIWILLLIEVISIFYILFWFW